ncbi:MAG: XVIPCD domain-containing protein [Rhodanobacter sp.]
MTDNIDTRNIDAVAGAVYFVVGRGTEGGPSDSYRLSVAGVRNSDWGDVGAVASNSGYSIGTIQVDLGQQGLRALGAASDRPLRPGEQTYVDAIIGQSSAYARANGLKFTDDLAGLRQDLLSHGDGRGKHASIHFIDADTRDSINKWASSSEGEQWIHQNIDYPQIKSITQEAVAMVDAYGRNIPEDRRFETICILAKTANQIPAKMQGFEKILKDGGDYEDIREHADKLRAAIKFYDGPKAAAIAETYETRYGAPGEKEILDRAHAKVSAPAYDPSAEKSDPDIQAALAAIGQSGHARGRHRADGMLRLGDHGQSVTALQADLAALGYTDGKGHPLKPDGDFGPATRAALEAFQHDHHLKADGVAGPKTLDAMHRQVEAAKMPGLDHAANPDHALYLQAQKAVRDLDARQGRTSDARSDNLAAALTVAARRDGLSRIDEVALSEDGSRAFAVQGGVVRQFAHVQTADAVNTPVAKSAQTLDDLHRRADPAQLRSPVPQHAPPAVNL